MKREGPKKKRGRPPKFREMNNTPIPEDDVFIPKDESSIPENDASIPEKKKRGKKRGPEKKTKSPMVGEKKRMQSQTSTRTRTSPGARFSPDWAAAAARATHVPGALASLKRSLGGSYSRYVTLPCAVKS